MRVINHSLVSKAILTLLAAIVILLAYRNRVAIMQSIDGPLSVDPFSNTL